MCWEWRILRSGWRKGKSVRGLLGELVESLIFEEDYSEALKLKLAIAVMGEGV